MRILGLPVNKFCCILDFAKPVKQKLKIQHDLHGIENFGAFIGGKVLVLRICQKCIESLSGDIRSPPNFCFPS